MSYWLAWRIAAGALVISLVMSFSACGFHLRGMTPQGAQQSLPFESLVLKTQPQTNALLVQTLRLRLQTQGVQLEDSEAQAQAVLTLENTQFQRITTATNGSGQVTAELLKLVQPYQLIAVASGEVIVSGKVASYRDRQVNPNALLADERERTVQLQQMARELADEMIQRLASLSAQQRQALRLDTETAPIQ